MVDSSAQFWLADIAADPHFLWCDSFVSFFFFTPFPSTRGHTLPFLWLQRPKEIAVIWLITGIGHRGICIFCTWCWWIYRQHSFIAGNDPVINWGIISAAVSNSVKWYFWFFPTPDLFLLVSQLRFDQSF